MPLLTSDCNWEMLGIVQFPELTGPAASLRDPCALSSARGGESSRPQPVHAGSQGLSRLASPPPLCHGASRKLGGVARCSRLWVCDGGAGGVGPGQGCGLPGVRLLWAGGLQPGGWAAPCGKPEGPTSEAYAKLTVTSCPCESQEPPAGTGHAAEPAGGGGREGVYWVAHRPPQLPCPVPCATGRPAGAQHGRGSQLDKSGSFPDFVVSPGMRSRDAITPTRTPRPKRDSSRKSNRPKEEFSDRKRESAGMKRRCPSPRKSSLGWTHER